MSSLVIGIEIFRLSKRIFFLSIRCGRCHLVQVIFVVLVDPLHSGVVQVHTLDLIQVKMLARAHICHSACMRTFNQTFGSSGNTHSHTHMQFDFSCVRFVRYASTEYMCLYYTQTPSLAVELLEPQRRKHTTPVAKSYALLSGYDREKKTHTVVVGGTTQSQ